MSVEALSPNRFKNVENVSCTYQAVVPAGVTLKDVLEPSFWAHAATEIDRRFRNHRIEVIAEDGSFDVDLRVLKVGERMVSVRLLREAPNTKGGVADISAEQELPRIDFVRGRGDNAGWRVLDATGQVYSDRIEGKENAQRILDQYRAENRIAA